MIVIAKGKKIVAGSISVAVFVIIYILMAKFINNNHVRETIKPKAVTICGRAK